MASLKKIKRRMLREAVDENLDLIRGPRVTRRSRRLSRLVTAAKVVFMVGLPAGLVATSMVLAEAAQGWVETSRAAVLRRRLPLQAHDHLERFAGGLRLPDDLNILFVLKQHPGAHPDDCMIIHQQ